MARIFKVETKKKNMQTYVCLFFFPSDDPAILSLFKKKECDELTHWHSFRPLNDDFERTRCNSDGKYN